MVGDVQRGRRAGPPRRRTLVVVAALAAVQVAVVTSVASPAAAAPEDGPGGPILVVTSAANPFSAYYAEILRNEGLNAFEVADLATVTPAALADHEVVLLGEVPVDAGQATMLADWVDAGGNLVAMRPDPDLADLVGVTDTGNDLAEAYLRIDTAPGGPGAGLVAETVQFHGTADRYDLDAGTEAVATLFSTASTSTTNPAVTLRSVGANGGQVAAFAYDLARSVVQTRQGNPAWAGQERDGMLPPILRATDMFFPDWVDLDKAQIPQADEQQRLLANLVLHVTGDAMPLPRFWYFPRGERAVVVMTGDDHANGGTAGHFDWAIGASPPGCDVEAWECVRSTSYVFPSTSIAGADAYEAQGFEIALHVDTGCADWTPAGLASAYDDQLAAFAAAFPDVAAPTTNRTHCITWSDWATQPQVAEAEGIRLDTNYYYWPAGWVANRPGYFTGSGMPMRFADLDGSMIDVYQAATQMTDESGMDYGLHISTLLDNAIGAPGYFGAVTANMHTDSSSHPGHQAVINAALARDVPVVSARQLLTWLDGRNGSTFEDLAWDGDELTFSIAAAPGSTGLQAMLPTAGGSGVLESFTLDGEPVDHEVETVKGVTYATFAAGAGTYSATYAADETAPAITSVLAVPTAPDEATVTWTTDEAATSRVDFGTSVGALSSSVEDAALTTDHELVLTGLDPGTTYAFRVSSTDGSGNGATSPPPPAAGSFTTPTAVATDTTVADFSAGTTGGSTAVSDEAGGEVILRPVLGEDFSASELADGWSSASWTGGTPVLAGGAAVVDGSWVRGDDLVSGGPGRSIEFAATFTGDPFQNAGFGVDLDGSGESWALFGTGASPGVLLARTLDDGGSIVDVPLGAQHLGAEHVFRIEWDDEVRFFVDGALVHTASTVSGTMRPVASDFATGGGALTVDWMRMGPYPSSGTFTSRVVDAGNEAEWGVLSSVATTPPGTAVALHVRTGPTPAPDGTWSAFEAVAPGDDVASAGRYLQYRAELSSSTGATTPALHSVTLPFDTSPDEQPPTVTARAPVPGAVDVDVATDVTVQFDEPVDADGIAGLVTLRAAGAPTDVAATVVVDGAVVTLDPSDDLAPSTEYDVTVSGAVTDVAGNPLGADDTWSFTTSATLTYLVDETDGDFGAGTTGAGTYVSRSGDGEVVLAPAVGAEFEGDVVPAGWTTSSWGGGSSTVVAGGSVTVDGERLSSDPLHPAGRSMEFVATFGAASFQHVGFGVDYDSVAAWAMFSTHNTGGSVLYARTHDGGAASNVPIGNLVGSPHHYRIDWLPGSVVFRVDGVVVHTETVTIATDMRPLVSDFSGGGAVLSLDWLRMGPYASAGTFTSRVLDAGAPVEWRTLDVTGATPAGSSAAFEVRTGGTTDPDDGSWSAFAPVADGADIPGTSRYAQYRVALSTSDPATTPVVERVALGSVALGPLPVVTGGAGVVVEGDSGTTTLVIPVTLSAPAGHEVTVAWSTIPSGDPVPGVDYETAGGTLTFEPGETEQHVEVTVLGDVLDEPGVFFGAEWLFVGLTPTGATLGSDFFAGVAHGFIVDDDPQPTIVGGIGSVVEGDAGTVTLQIPVTLSAPSAATVSVAWATAVSPGLVAGVDFEAASGTVTFAPGDTEEVVSITVHGDDVDEPGVVFGAEWLFLQLSSPVHASFGSGFFATVAHGFIVDDD